MNNLTKYRKSVVAALGFVLTLINVAYGTDPTWQAVIALATALGVYQVPNTYTKLPLKTSI